MPIATVNGEPKVSRWTGRGPPRARSGGSDDQHAVAVAEEAVVCADGEGVRGKRALSSRKCAHHHDER